MFRKFTFLFLLGAGVFLLIQVIMPIISFKFWEYTFYQENIALLSPDPRSQALGVSIRSINSFPALISSNKRSATPPYSTFSLSIPAIKLFKAEVWVDNNDFENHLAHLPGSALPGEKGNVFITGHSSLPQFFETNNYKAIFAHLPKVKKGDQIIIDTGGQIFTYQVTGLQIVSPFATGVINSPDDTGRYLSLMTCVPPGLYLKRLIVLAVLQ